MFSLKALQKWVVRLILAVLAIIICLWLVGLFWLPGFIHREVGDFGNRIGYQIRYDTLNISPLRLHVEIKNFHLGKVGGDEFFTLNRLSVGLKGSKLLNGELGFDEITLDQPSVLLERNIYQEKPAGWNWQELISAINAALPKREGSQKSNPLKISAAKLSVHNAKLSISDSVSQVKELLNSLSVELLDVANYDSGGQVDGVRGQYDLSLGGLDFLVPGTKKKIHYEKVLVDGRLSNPKFETLGAEINLKLDDGKVNSSWELNTNTNSANGKITFNSLSVAPFVPLLPANKDLRAQSGLVNADLAVQFEPNSWALSGNVDLLDVSIFEAGELAPLLAWKKGDIGRIEFKKTTPDKISLSIDEVAIIQPQLRFEINEAGLSNFRRLFAKETQDTPDTQVQGSSQKTQFILDMRSVKLQDGAMFFSDLAMRPNFKVDIRKFNAAVLGISNIPGRFASLAMDGVVAGSGSMRAKGQISFDDPRRNHDVSILFRSVPLSAGNPVLMTFAGYQINDGRLDLTLNYKSKDGELMGGNRFVIKEIELGDEVPNFEGKKLPLGLAIALLEDSDRIIDVSISIAGNVDSPEFSASGLVWQAIKTILSNVATAPFRALASLMGMENVDAVNAVLGESIFLSDDQNHLEKFGEILSKKPNATLELIGTFDPAADRQELSRAKADSAILKEAGFKISTGEPLPSPSLSDPRVQAAIRSAYADKIGRIKLTQRILMLPDNEARYQQLRDELIEAYAASDDDLKALAGERSKTAKEIMVKGNPGLNERIEFGDAQEISSNKDGVPLLVQLKIK